jgi:Flp pilus assembly protein TadD
MTTELNGNRRGYYCRIILKRRVADGQPGSVLKPDVPEALTVRGRALIALQRPKEAIDDFKKAIALDPQDAATHFQLARAYRQAGLAHEADAENAIFERMDVI